MTLTYGMKSGNFTKVGTIGDITACSGRCCKFARCDLALLVERVCYLVTCHSKKTCATRLLEGKELIPKINFVKRYSEKETLSGAW